MRVTGKFKVGDLVKLGCGSRNMVVGRVVDLDAASATGRDIGVHCDWHDDAGRPHTACYDEEELLLVL